MEQDKVPCTVCGKPLKNFNSMSAHRAQSHPGWRQAKVEPAAPLAEPTELAGRSERDYRVTFTDGSVETIKAISVFEACNIAQLLKTVPVSCARPAP